MALYMIYPVTAGVWTYYVFSETQKW
jgi:hypothetical protein